MSLLVGLLTFTATVAIHVENTSGVSDEQVSLATEGLSKSIRERGGGNVVIDAIGGIECEQEDRCLDQIRQRTKSDDTVMLSMLGVPTRIRVLAERIDEKRNRRQAQIDLPRESTAWSKELGNVTTILFPELEKPDTKIVRVQDEPTGPLPWLLLGASAATAIGTVVSGLTSAAARNNVQTNVLTDSEIDAESGRATRFAVVANVLGILTVAGVHDERRLVVLRRLLQPLWSISIEAIPEGQLAGPRFTPRTPGERIPLFEGRLVMGRGNVVADISLPHASVGSRRPFALLVEADRLLFIDHGSTNGAWINGKMIRGEREMKHGDEVTISGFVLRFEKEPSAT